MKTLIAVIASYRADVGSVPGPENSVSDESLASQYSFTDSIEALSPEGGGTRTGPVEGCARDRGSFTEPPKDMGLIRIGGEGRRGREASMGPVGLEPTTCA